ncbi:MAG: methyltransferase domain-containing protein [Nitrospirota bacterium]
MSTIYYLIMLWLKGIKNIFENLWSKDKTPTGQINGIISPLLETLRIGHAVRWIEGDWVLDCGCGRGKLYEMTNKKISYTGVDSDPLLIEHLQEYYPEAAFFCARAEELPFDESNQFDVIVMTALLEHIEKPGDLLHHLCSFLRPNGIIVLTTPNPYFNKLLHIGSRLGFFDKHADEEHKQLLCKSELRDMFLKSGLRVERYYRFLFGGNQLIIGRKSVPI